MGRLKQLGIVTVGGLVGVVALLGAGWGVAFHHYLVDARIWRLRRAPGVARAIDGGAVRQAS